jgi:hypothetical protein
MTGSKLSKFCDKLCEQIVKPMDLCDKLRVPLREKYLSTLENW